jgi:transposase
MTKPLVIVGIDVSEATVDVGVRPTGTTFRVANNPNGIAARVELARKPTTAKRSSAAGTAAAAAPRSAGPCTWQP